MPLPWIRWTANEPALEACTALLSHTGTPGLKGRLIFVMGSPRAGASALAQQLYRVARKQRVKTLMLGETPSAGNTYIRNHILRSLQLPLVVSEFKLNDLVSRPYEAIFAMKEFKVIIIDDGHDYFTGQSYVAARNVDTLIELASALASRLVFIFGHKAILARRALLLEKLGIEIIQVNLGNMTNDDEYCQLVDATRHAFSKRLRRDPPAINAQALYGATNGSVGLTIDLVRNIVRYPPIADMLSILIQHSVLLESSDE